MKTFQLLFARLIHGLSFYFGRSIRRQLVWSMSVVSLLLMLSFSVSLYLHQKDFLYKATTESAHAFARSMASSSVSWILANDLAGLQEMLHGLQTTQDIKLALVLSKQGEVLGATDEALIGHYVNDAVSLNLLASSVEPHMVIDHHDFVDVAQPIMAGDHLIGWARIELSRASSNENLRMFALAGFGFALLAVIVVLFVAVILARQVTRGLYHLVEVSEKVELGDRLTRSEDDRCDEVGQLARSFNKMLDALSNSEDKLTKLNSTYAAWTACNRAATQEHDEAKLIKDVCQILAELVPFQLVCVGQLDRKGWLHFVAESGIATDCLADVRISTDANKPEGKGPLCEALREGKPTIVNDITQTPECAISVNLAKAHGIQSAGAFPIFKRGKCFGVVAVYSKELEFFTPELIGLLSGMTEDLSLALQNIDLERQRLADLVELERAARVFEHSKEAILVTDSDNIIISTNRSFTQITGYQAEDAIGKSPQMLSSGRHDADFYKQMWNTLTRFGSWQGEIWNKRKNGQIFPEDLTIISVKNDDGAIINHIAIFSDISDRKLAESRIQQLAHYDVLTGLPNRVLFNDRFSQSLIHAQRNNSTVALLFLDLDRFKQINDTLGHDVGDELLKMVSSRLKECVRDQDTVSRQGGDEFTIVLPGTDKEGAELVAQKMLERTIEPYRISGHELHISSSIGIAIYPDQASDSTSLIKLADIAMYKAKEGGRNRFQTFDPSMNSEAYERLTLQNDLRMALERCEFELYYQPQVNLLDGGIFGCEALIRWHHPELGLLSPGAFVSLAEETGLINPISDWVLKQAIQQCSAWREAGLPNLVMAVNLSALQFREGNLRQQVSQLLTEFNLPADSLDLELTEGILMQAVERNLLTLNELTALGVTISIDDFGTGYSSLSYLKRFPIQKLKIDQSFVRDVTIDSSDAAMVRTIIVMAHSLKLKTIAEGVETEDQAQFLLEVGCDSAQGYLYGRPMPADQFAEWVKQKAL